MPSATLWFAAVVISVFAIFDGVLQLLDRCTRRSGQTVEAAPAAEDTTIDTVIARQINVWLPAPLQTARIYAQGLVTGAIAPVTDAVDWKYVPAALGRMAYEQHKASGFHWTIGSEEWQIGIGSIHGLAHGVIESAETGESYGVETRLNVPWTLYAEDLEDTGLTLEDVSAAFSGDLLAAARAFLRACELHPIP